MTDRDKVDEYNERLRAQMGGATPASLPDVVQVGTYIRPLAAAHSDGTQPWDGEGYVYDPGVGPPQDRTLRTVGLWRAKIMLGSLTMAEVDPASVGPVNKAQVTKAVRQLFRSLGASSKGSWSHDDLRVLEAAIALAEGTIG